MHTTEYDSVVREKPRCCHGWHCRWALRPSCEAKTESEPCDVTRVWDTKPKAAREHGKQATTHGHGEQGVGEGVTHVAAAGGRAGGEHAAQRVGGAPRSCAPESCVAFLPGGSPVAS